ncbi:hypothetical protein LOTGIDRAFT_224176 [Lottia gigantea]|uniref:Neuroguidin n=1 Tax=Lottia gigantea TaxID=225164 RepID=V4BC92_LOTGI|nr:hypothetical protein LOTGIDRAFT_224176 [Lottia gigantea]ESP03737.1 hypothetical protein LOTGIDRAFT_224176 [Lottia gigantea]
MEAKHMEQIVEQDLPKVKSTLKDIKDNLTGTIPLVSALIDKVQNGNCPTAKGVSFLELKFEMLLNYLINLVYVMLRKTSGLTILDDPAIERLVEIRTVLERMRPIDQTLKYQIDKLIKTAQTGKQDSNDPLRFKAKPGNFATEDDEGEDEDGEVKKYVAPKVAPVAYKGDLTAAEQEDLIKQRAVKRVLSSRMLKELRHQYDDAPEEIREAYDVHRLRENKKEREKTEYEEERFLRLPSKKRQKGANNELATLTSLNKITQFGDMSALSADDGIFKRRGAKKMKMTPGMKKKSKGKKTPKGSKSKFKKRK